MWMIRGSSESCGTAQVATTRNHFIKTTSPDAIVNNEAVFCLIVLHLCSSGDFARRVLFNGAG